MGQLTFRAGAHASSYDPESRVGTWAARLARARHIRTLPRSSRGSWWRKGREERRARRCAERGAILTNRHFWGKSANAEITRDQTCWFNFRSFGDANFVTKCSLGVAYANRLRARREKAKKATTAARSPLCDPLGADRRAARSGTRCSLHPRDRVAAARSDPETRRPRRAVRVRRVTRNERENIPNDPGATDL